MKPTHVLLPTPPHLFPLLQQYESYDIKSLQTRIAQEMSRRQIRRNYLIIAELQRLQLHESWMKDVEIDNFRLDNCRTLTVKRKY
jgi:hypothetical protein